MRGKVSALLFLLLVMAPRSARANNIDIVLIGVTQGGAPALEESFEKRLNENLSVMPEFSIVDYQQTQTYRARIHFDEFPVVSRKMVEALKLYCNDTTVFVWGTVKNCAVKGARRGLILGAVAGELTVSLNVYSLRYKNYAFSGDIRAAAEKSKGMVFFGSAEDEIMVSAIDRKEIIERMADEAALKSANLIGSIIQSERLHAEKENASSAANKYEVPSVSDMFNMPSVEAASVIKNRQKPKPSAPGSASGNQTPPPKAPEKPSPSPAPSKPALPKDTAKAGGKPQ
jgi:hypothetical protein